MYMKSFSTEKNKSKTKFHLNRIKVPFFSSEAKRISHFLKSIFWVLSFFSVMLRIFYMLLYCIWKVLERPFKKCASLNYWLSSSRNILKTKSEAKRISSTLVAKRRVGWFFEKSFHGFFEVGYL